MVTRRSLLLAPLVALATAMSAITGVGVGAADTNYHSAAGWAQSPMGLGNATSAGAGVNIYVIDGGMNVSLPEFGGRASVAKDFFDIPLVFIADTPGVLPGLAEEANGVIVRGGRVPDVTC